MEVDLKKKVNESTDFINSHLKEKFIPHIGIILGSGLGELAKHIQVKASIEYDDIPNFPTTTVAGHKGKLVFGKIADKNVIAMQGRFHYYEGYSLDEVTFPVRLMKNLGTQILIVSNAAGGLNPSYELADLVLISDHINFTGLNPLIGSNDDSLGMRFPDMFEVYDSNLIRLAKSVAEEEDIRVHEGVYIGVTGPNLETKAEYKMMRAWGADLVGMSTVSEVIVAIHAGLRVLGISSVTDLCHPEALEPVDIERILDTASKAEPKLTNLVKKVIEKL